MSHPSPRVPAKKAGKCDRVVATLRSKILEGRWQSGAQLPPRLQLLRTLNTTPVTLHHAVQRLVRDGFLRTAAGAGTFVTAAPPHLNTYAVIFVFDPAAYGGEVNWSRYYQALTQAVARFQQETGKRILQFHGIDEHTDSPDRKRLISHIKRQNLAGLIFANPPFQLAGTPILDSPGIPRVALTDKQSYPHVPIVKLDGDMWVERALDYLAALGRRHVAILSFGGPDSDAWVRAGLAARGMVSHRRWTQFVSMRQPEGARRAVELLMHDRERPDALLVADDNFVEQALAGLADAGMKVPAGIAVIGHANFPVAPSKVSPVRLLGYDAALTLRTCVDLIDRQRRGEIVPGETTLPALWEEEVGGLISEIRGQRSESRLKRTEVRSAKASPSEAVKEVKHAQ